MKQILVIVVTLLLLCSIALGGLIAPPKPPVADIYMTAGNGTHSNAWDLGDRVAVNCLIITHVTGTWTFEVAVQPLHWDHAYIEHTCLFSGPPDVYTWDYWIRMPFEGDYHDYSGYTITCSVYNHIDKRVEVSKTVWHCYFK